MNLHLLILNLDLLSFIAIPIFLLKYNKKLNASRCLYVIGLAACLNEYSKF